MNYKEKIEGILNVYVEEYDLRMARIIGEEQVAKDLVEELTTLIQQEVDARANAKEKEIEEKAVREFADWIQKQAHGYNATVYIPTNQEYTRVCDIYALVEQFIAERKPMQNQDNKIKTKSKKVKVAVQSCEHLDWDNQHDCNKKAKYVCMCCGAGVCEKHKERECPYGGMGYIDL